MFVRSIISFSLAAVVAVAGVLPANAQTFTTPQVYVQDVTLQKDAYRAGETVQGSFVLRNAGQEVVPAVYYRISSIGNYTDSRLPGVIYDSVNAGPVALMGGESKRVEFTYNLPAGIENGRAGINVRAFLESGLSLGWNDAFFTSSGGSVMLEVLQTSVNVGDEKFGIQDGPTLLENEVAVFEMSVRNRGGALLAVYPEVTVYERTASGEILYKNIFDEVTVVAGGDGRIAVELPRMDDEPGVYVAVIRLVDEHGALRAPAINARYIVGGEIATIHSILANSTSARSGDTVRLSIYYSGTPYDLMFREEATPSDATLRVRLKNEKGNVVAESNEVIDYNTGTQKTVNLIIGERARALAVEVEIEKDGKVLATYSENLSPDYQSGGLNTAALLALLIGLGALITTVIVLLVMKFFKRPHTPADPVSPSGPTGPMTTLVILLGVIAGGLLFGAQTVDAFTVTKQENFDGKNGNASYDKDYIPRVFVNSPSGTLEGGQEFYLTGNVVATGGVNRPQDLKLTVVYEGRTRVYEVGRDITDDSSHPFLQFGHDFSFGPFTAPRVPGMHKIELRVDNYTNISFPKEEGNYGYTEGYQEFTVVSPNASCPFVPGGNKIIAYFDGRLVAPANFPDEGTMGETPKFTTNLSPDTYKVTLYSYDSYPARAGVSPQPDEKWFVKFWNGNQVVASSGVIDDLQDRVQTADRIQVVNNSLVISNSITHVSAQHARYPGAVGSSPDSVFPICAMFESTTNNDDPDGDNEGGSFDYGLTNSGQVTVEPGSSGVNFIQLELLQGSTRKVDLSVSGLPSNFTVSWPDGNNCDPNCERRLRIDVPSDAEREKVYQVTVTGSPYNKQTHFNLVVPPAAMLNVSCDPYNTNNQIVSEIKVGQSVIWKARVEGDMQGPFTYSWSGTNGLSGEGSEVQITYSTIGRKEATVFVSGPGNASGTCSGEVVSSVNPQIEEI